MNKAVFCALICVCAVITSAPAAAETLRIEGVRPAGSAALIGVRTVQSDRFTGQDGAMFAMMVEDRLRDASYDGEPWLRVLPNGSNEEPDVVLTGFAQAEVNFVKELAKRQECVERDDAEKCIRKEWVERECRRRVIELTAQIRFTRTDGMQLFRKELVDSESIVICRGDDNIPGEEGEIRALMGKMATAFTQEFFPIRETPNIRVLERRKDLPKADQALFKTALKATKRDPYQACVIWSEMGARYPRHATLLFNQGLCRESVGDRAGAAEFYRATLAINPKEDYASKGLSRIAFHDRGDAQVAAHFGE